MNMKKFIFCLIALVVAVVMTSCEKEVDLGYPQTVNFAKDGGEKTVTGVEPFTDAHIHDYNSGDQGSVLPNEGDVDIEVFKWLKIEYVAHSTELKIIAEPNTSAKSRQLHIELHSGQEYHVIKVIQE